MGRSHVSDHGLGLGHLCTSTCGDRGSPMEPGPQSLWKGDCGGWREEGLREDGQEWDGTALRAQGSRRGPGGLGWGTGKHEPEPHGGTEKRSRMLWRRALGVRTKAGCRCGDT